MKKALKITAALAILLIVVLAIIPYFFKGKIKQQIKSSINEQVNAQVDFSDANISLLSGFPNITLTIEDLKIINFEPFEGKTLAEIEKVAVRLPLSNILSFFSGKLSVNSFTVTGCDLNLITNKQGIANYDISKPTTSEVESKETADESEGVNLAVKEYQILKSNLKYSDFSSNIHLNLDNINHKGAGDFSSAISNLKTNTSTLLSFNYDDFEYFNKKTLDLEATLKLDLEKMKFSFLENQANLDKLKLVFDGFFQLNENDMMLDLAFNTPSSEFSNLFNILPSNFQSYFNEVDATGNFAIDGRLKGVVDDKHIPTINLNMVSNGASFKHKNLNSSVENIAIDVSITNKTGLSDDTKVELKKLFFNIEEDRFDANAFVELFENPRVSMSLDSKFKLENLYNTLNLEALEGMKGNIVGEIQTSFDMEAIKKNRYHQTKSKGNVELSNFIYKSEEMKETLNIKKAIFRIENDQSYLDKLTATTGKSDLMVAGKLENLLGYLFNNEAIKGDFSLDSNNFVVDDFLSETEEEEVTENKQPNEVALDQVTIPDYLNLNFKLKAKQASYNSINLKDFEGILVVKDQKAMLKNISFGLFKGRINLDGEILTKSKTPTFDFSLNAQNFDIAQSFSQLELFNTVAPISDFVEGILNSNIKISGKLDKELSPIMASIKGNADSQLLSSRVHLEDNATFKSLASNFDFLDEKTIDLSNLKTHLSFEDGKVQVKPFNIKYKDIPVEFSGSHGFDLSMNYDVKLMVPAQYFSSYLDGIVSLTDEEKKDMVVPVNAKLTGDFTKPLVSTDLKTAIASLTSQIAKKKAGSLIENGKKELLKFFNR